jgi:hypothetical protein
MRRCYGNFRLINQLLAGVEQSLLLSAPLISRLYWLDFRWLLFLLFLLFLMMSQVNSPQHDNDHNALLSFRRTSNLIPAISRLLTILRVQSLNN